MDRLDILDQMPSVALLQSACRRLRPDDQSPFALPSASAQCVLTDWPALSGDNREIPTNSQSITETTEK